jgi:hypothetical protein
MPTKRRPLKRPQKPVIDAETLDLFEKLDRQKRPSREEEHDLMRRLGLTDHYWTSQSVLNRHSRPAHPPQYLAHRHWHECRAVRQQLLEALAARPPVGPADAPPEASEAPDPSAAALADEAGLATDH